jgi:acyl-CoA thioesterase-1
MLRRTFLLGLSPVLAWGLPRVLIVGDSISIGYTPYVQQKLSGGATVVRIESNGADSANVRAHIEEWLSANYDLVSINCGLHDLKFTDRHQVPVGKYEENLNAIFNAIQKHGAKALWVTTTPIHDERHAARRAGFARFDRDVKRYNEVATRVATSRHIALCDLNEVVEKKGVAEML